MDDPFGNCVLGAVEKSHGTRSGQPLKTLFSIKIFHNCKPHYNMEERAVKEFLREAWEFSPKNDAFEIREIRPLDFFTLFVILEKVFPNLTKKDVLADCVSST